MASSVRRWQRTGSGQAADRQRWGRGARRAPCAPARAERGRSPEAKCQHPRAASRRRRQHRPSVRPSTALAPTASVHVPPFLLWLACVRASVRLCLSVGVFPPMLAFAAIVPPAAYLPSPVSPPPTLPPTPPPLRLRLRAGSVSGKAGVGVSGSVRRRQRAHRRKRLRLVGKNRRPAIAVHNRSVLSQSKYGGT